MGVGGKFSAGAEAWLSGVGLVRDAVRQELVHRQLVAHLPEGDSSRCSTPAVGRGALEAFDARHYKSRLGIEPVRADEPGEVQAALTAKGASVVAWYGVRLFTDHGGPERPGPDFNELLAARQPCIPCPQYCADVILVAVMRRVEWPISPGGLLGSRSL